MGAIWAISLTTSLGMWPVHLERASKFTGLMTWSVDRSILWRKESCQVRRCSLLGGFGAGGTVGHPWPLGSLSPSAVRAQSGCYMPHGSCMCEEAELWSGSAFLHLYTHVCTCMCAHACVHVCARVPVYVCTCLVMGRPPGVHVGHHFSICFLAVSP